VKRFVIIPAHYDSKRFPGKVLADILGKPMVQHSYETAKKAGFDQVIIATDDERVVKAVKNFNGDVMLTAKTHRSGTERMVEVIDKAGIADDDVVVNFQCDEPFMPPVNIEQVAGDLLEHPEVSVATLCEPIENLEEVFNLNINKVVMDKEGYALYFSHTPIPWYRDGFGQETKVMPEDITYYRHVGIYAMRAGFAKDYLSWPPSLIETVESLEQLRVLWYGKKIHVAMAKKPSGSGIDTKEELDKLIALRSS